MLQESVYVDMDPHIGRLPVQDLHLHVHAPAGSASICITQLLIAHTMSLMDDQNHHLEILPLQCKQLDTHQLILRYYYYRVFFPW